MFIIKYQQEIENTSKDTTGGGERGQTLTEGAICHWFVSNSLILFSLFQEFLEVLTLKL